MKFIEELFPGDCFTSDNNFYIITTDFKKNNSRLCVCLTTGCARWFDPSYLIESTNIYRLDKENNIIPFKETKKDDVS